MLICPVCASPLTEKGRAFCCEKGHSFDIAAEGYCNLLTGSKAGQFIGDNKEMVAARRSFLQQGLYEPLQKAVCKVVSGLLTQSGVVLDAGCGEGYYTGAVARYLKDIGCRAEVYGMDISKTATRYAAKRDKLSRYFTASSYHLPLEERSVDVIMSLFAPVPAEEFSRILAPGGKVLQVVPGAEHLWELKQAVYEEPYRNREDKHTLAGFTELERRELTYRGLLEGSQQIRALFDMTPYAHRTPAEGKKKLESLDHLEVTMSFVLIVYEKAR